MHTRRQFLKTTLAGSTVLMANAPSVLAAPPSPAKMPNTICAFEKPFQHLSYDELADVIAELGFDGIEATVRDGGHVLPERVEEDLPKMVEALKQRGLEITVMASSVNTVDQPNTPRVLRTAARLGIKMYRMAYFRYDLTRPVLAQLEAIRSQFRDLAAFNRTLGLTALYQNHAGAAYVGGPIWDLHHLIRDLDPRDAGMAFDIRHATVEGGLSWEVQYNLMKPHLGAVFVKDSLWEAGKIRNVPLGQGQVDAKFYKLLKQDGYRGPISIHVEYLDARSRDTRMIADAFRRDLAALKSLLAG